MLIDFVLLKNVLRTVCNKLDHTNLNDNPAFLNDPSAERVARHIFDETAALLPPEAAKALYAADVYETPSSMARYTRS
jgi:6-pyruvoyltetrahydropterin/6-carboxytetrahydropterin synthase